jgi:hypothetical protein
MTDGQPPPAWPPYVPLPPPYRPGGRHRLGTPFDWLACLAAAAAFGCSFGTVYSTSVTLTGVGGGFATRPAVFERTQRMNAWHGFFGWFAVVLTLLAAALIVLAVASRRPIARVVAAVAAAAAAVFILVAAVVNPSTRLEDEGRSALRQARGFGLDFRLTIEHDRGVGYWLVLAAVLVALVLTLIGARREHTRPQTDQPPPALAG